MQIINTTDLNEARKQAEKLRKEGKAIIVLSQDDEFNRKVLEIKGLKMLVINENFPRKDYMKQRASGLNEILAKICAEKNITIGVQINEIIKKSDVEKSKSLARLKQNIMLCKKTGAKIVSIDCKDRYAVSSLFLILGANTKQSQESIFK